MTPQRTGTLSGGWTSRQPEDHLALAWSAVLVAVLAVLLTALGMAGLGGAGVGSVLAAAAFVLAVVAAARGVRWRPLWLPLALLPLLLVTAPWWV
jgi:hypothetical protein